jgi:hypothetical protein
MMTRFLTLALLLGMTSAVQAADCPHCGRADCQIDHHERAGCPTCIRHFAIPSNTYKYSGGIVGGGAPLWGDLPYCDEGTWGWDYTGVIPKHVWLGWSHKKYQAGGGKYDTDRRKRR